MTTITITDIADLRAGDIATCSYEVHEFTGEVWEGVSGELLVGGTFVRYGSGYPSSTTSLVSATREVPLPTDLGSVIANVVTEDGDRYDRAMLTDPRDSLGLMWIVSSADRSDWVRPDEITSWDACTVEVQS